jgi:apolipoprotein N-acyltransferase
LKSIYKLTPWIQVIISGFAVGITYHPFNIGFLAWVGFIPLLRIFINGDFKSNIINGYIFGLTYNFIAFYWIGLNSGASFIIVVSSLIVAVLYLSLYWAIAGLVISIIPIYLRKSIGTFLFPFLIVTIEWLRSFGALGFPWANLALSQSKYIYLLQILEITGTYGISFIVISINVIIYNAIDKKRIFKEGFIPVIILLFGISIVGWSRIKSLTEVEKEISVVIVQPNIDPNIKWHEKRKIISFMDSLHHEAAKLKPDIIVFPETALPAYLTKDTKTREMLQETVNIYDIPLLTGTIDVKIEKKNKNYYNSAMWLTPNSDFQIYSKIHLVPFAEYDLFPSIFHPLTWLNINIDRGSFKSGKEHKIFHWKNISFSNIICYESSMPDIVREFVSKGSELLIIQANDGWLGNSYGPHQHFELARLRAIENRIPVLRSANTGISGIIRPDGTIQRKIGLDKQLIFKENIIIRKSGSIYTLYGDIFALVCFLVTLLISAFSCKKRFT